MNAPFLRRLLLLGLAMAATTACGRHDDGYLPLRGGMRWQYDIDIVTMAGPRQQKLIVENLPAVEIEGAPATPRRTVDGSVYYYREDAAGIARIARALDGEETRLLSAPETVLRYPAAANTAWSGKTRTVVLEKITPPEGSLTRIEEDLEMRYVIEDTEDTVSVPAGRFEGCLRVKGTAAVGRNIGLYIGSTDLRIESTEWYAPGVGLVKAVRRETTSDPTFPQGEYTLQLTALRR